ncbi:MAG: transglutaminase family protein [Leptolyngbyaceae cyanobacterium SL_7_1]|nr:transglutaminase family protein [Leptolyngbyaceae cyanobacterium SL_7_1]
MRVEAGCRISFEADAATPAIFMLRPRSGAGQWIIREEYTLDPIVPVVEYTDSYGNLCQRLIAPAGSFQIQTSAIVETAESIDTQLSAPYVPVENLPDEVIQFLLPSRYCQSDQLYDLAIEIAGDRTPGYDQVEAIRDWIHTQIDYRYGTSDASTSAVDTAAKRVGVCRDFSHLGIALSRSLNIPARMVVGYLYELEPMDLHAWLEVFVGDRWYIFDATQAEPRGNRITIAYGRDAADVALVTQFGPMKLVNMNVWVDTAE